MSDTLTATEAGDIFGLDREQLRAMQGGKDDAGHISVKQILGLYITNELLRMKIAQKEAAAISLAAFLEADPEKRRCISIGWRADGTRLMVWLDQIRPELLGPSLNKPLLILPVDLWLAELIQAVNQHRVTSARLH